jgi:hypothetical protein
MPWHGDLHVNLDRGWRRSGGNLHLRDWRLDIQVASRRKKNHCAGQ